MGSTGKGFQVQLVCAGGTVTVIKVTIGVSAVCSDRNTKKFAAAFVYRGAGGGVVG